MKRRSIAAIHPQPRARHRNKASRPLVPITNHIPLRTIESLIYLVRGQKVMLDRDLANLYHVETRTLNQAVHRNRARFPQDFMFRLTAAEASRMRSQIVIASPELEAAKRSALKRNLRHPPRAFTEQGVAMLSSVLRSARAVQVNVEIMRAFVRLRVLLASNADLARRLQALEKRYDRKFKVVFDAIRGLMISSTSPPPKREIGFHTLRSGAEPSEKAAARRT